jgi:circadian clock protein KaiB
MKKINPGTRAREKFILQLYVAGMSQRSMEAIENLKKICDEYLKNSFSLEIIDLYKHPEIAGKQQIIFSPSLVKHKPLPKRTLVGNFSDSAKVINALGIGSNE